MNLAQNIQMLRRRACLSQEELASQLGVSRQSVSKWESDAATPELDKLTQMAHLFHVSLDELVGELPPEDAAPQQLGQPPAAAPAGRKRRMLPWLLWAASALLCLWLGAAFFSPSPSEQPMEPSLSEVQTLSLPALRQSLVATFFDLAAAERFDYVPFFPEGDPPRHANEYLLYAFALRLDEWGDEKGRMTEQYVEETVRTHFDRYNIAHGPLVKAWDYDAETGIYTAIPQGIKSLPMCSLRDFRFSIRDGSPLFDVTLDFCSFDGVEPGPDEAAQVRQSLLEGDFSYLKVQSTERFLFTVDEEGVLHYLAHESVAP